MASLLALLSHPSEITGVDEGVTSQAVVFIIDEFDMFTYHSRQTLLYNLFDIAQARKAPIAVLGCTGKVDVVEMLEKRVKSRFSHRYVFVPPARSLPAYWDICKQGLIVDGEVAETVGLKTDLEGFDEFMEYWSKKIDVRSRPDLSLFSTALSGRENTLLTNPTAPLQTRVFPAPSQGSFLHNQIPYRLPNVLHPPSLNDFFIKPHLPDPCSPVTTFSLRPALKASSPLLPLRPRPRPSHRGSAHRGIGAHRYGQLLHGLRRVCVSHGPPARAKLRGGHDGARRRGEGLE